MGRMDGGDFLWFLLGAIGGASWLFNGLSFAGVL